MLSQLFGPFASSKGCIGSIPPVRLSEVLPVDGAERRAAAVRITAAGQSTQACRPLRPSYCHPPDASIGH